MDDKEIRQQPETTQEERLEDTVRLEVTQVVQAAQECAPEETVEDTGGDDTQEFDLEDIMKEFSDHPDDPKEETQPEEEPQPLPRPEQTATSDTVRLDTKAVQSATSDTVRLDTKAVEKATRKEQKVRGAVRITKDESQEPFSEQWEPEYEQPMGAYVPPQPIAFRPRSRIRELKRKLVAGPERRYYELAEAGLGKLQISIAISLLVVILCAAATVLYGMGMVPENRLKLMVFGQCFAMVLSALLGCGQLIEGVADIFKKRFTPNTMLVFTFLACCADGILGLRQQRIPCCAAFSLAMTMSLWSACQSRSAEMGQMDALRKAVRLDGVVVSTDYYKGRKGLLRTEGELDDFMDNYRAPSGPEKVICWYSLAATLAGLGLGVTVYVLYGDVTVAVQVAAVSLLAAMPATIFITLTRPMAVLQRKLHNVGTVICGWQGVKALKDKSVFPVEYSDLFPVGSARMNGVKFFGSRSTDEVVAYGTALISANGSGLTPLFEQVLDSRNGYHYECTELRCYDNGGIGGIVRGEQVLVGPISFLKEMGVEIPSGMRVNQAVCVAIEGQLCGLFALTYENARAAEVGLVSLCTGRKTNAILATADFLLSVPFLRSRFGINPRRLQCPSFEEREALRGKQPDEGKPAAILVTREGLAGFASGVTGARALRTASILGTAVHLIGGILGLAIMVILTLLGRWDLLTPANMFAYQLVWMIPGLLVSEWTRAV